jgi:hypothetical protein
MMEVRCINCGIFFSIDDNGYRGEYENFCGTKCQSDWMDKERNKAIEEPAVTPSSDETATAFKWPLPKEKEDGKGN